MSFLLAVSPILLAALSPASGQCEPPSGWEQVLSDEQIRWIVIGETYGTKEIPELFLDTICATAGKRRLIIAVDQPASRTPRKARQITTKTRPTIHSG